MSKLVVSRLKCIDTTSGLGNDQVYMVILRGSFTAPPDMVVQGGKNSVWGDMGDGKLVVNDMVFDSNYSPNNVYVAILLEQDGSSRDVLVGDTGARIIEFWANYWHKGTGSSYHESVALMAVMFFSGIQNDDVIGVREIPQFFSDGAFAVRKFAGDGGDYRARFVRRA